MQTQNRATYTGCDVLKLLSNFGVLLKNNTGNILIATIRMKNLKRFFFVYEGSVMWLNAPQNHRGPNAPQNHRGPNAPQKHRAY